MPQEGVLVEIAVQVVLHVVETLLDIVALRGGDGVLTGRLDGDGIAVDRLKPRLLVLGIGIHLHEIAAGQGHTLIVFTAHLRDGHTVLVHLNLVTELVTAFIFAVQQHIHSPPVRGIGHPQTLTQLKGQQVPHQGLVTVVVDERPFLGLSRGFEHVLFLIELDTVGLFRKTA